MAPERALLRYLGGKYRLAQWIIAHMPPHDAYVEAFGGAGSVLLAKPPAEWEVLNDIDGDIVNLFAVLRSACAAALVEVVRLTPYSRREYDMAFEPTEDPVERARRLLVRSHMGHGTGSSRLDRKTGFRSDGAKFTTRVAGEWADFPIALEQIIERLRPVTLECRPALDVMARYDSPRALVYLDPPYMPETRSAKAKRGEGYHAYSHDMTVEEHSQLLETALASRSMVMISGYRSDLYDDRLSAWTRLERTARSHGGGKRVEVLWLNPRAAARDPQGSLL